MITRVRLRNWKSHLETELAFGRGVNALVGIMGSGKSSVLDGVCFGLYGTFPALQSRKVALEELVMAAPQPKDEATIEVAFRLGADEYAATRTVARGKGTQAELRVNGQLREVNSRGVTEEIARVLQMDYELFSKAVYAEQNALDYFLRIPAGQRRLHLDRMLGVDRFEVARAEAVSLHHRVRAGREEKAKVIVDMEREGLERRAAGLKDEAAALARQLQQAEERQLAAEQQSAALERAVAAAEAQERQAQETKRLLEGLRGGMEQVRLRGEQARAAVGGRDLGRIDAALKALADAVESRRRELDGLKADLHAVRERQRSEGEHADRLADLGDRCPLCESALSEDRKNRLAAAKRTMSDFLKEEAAKKHRLVFGKESELQAVERLLEDKRLERDRALRGFQELRELEEKLQEMLQAQGRYEQTLARERMPSADLAALRKGLQEALASGRELGAEARNLRGRLAEREEARDETERRLQLLLAYRGEFAEAEHLASQLEAFGQALRLTQEGLRKEFLTTVNGLLESVWRELYPYRDLSAVRLAVEGGDYQLQVRGRDWADVETASGGERSLACLALRIAFSLAFLPGLRWLILDEPTHNLDAHAIASLSQVLQQKLPRFAEQAFLITHDPALSEGLERVYRLERDKAAGGPTRVTAG